MLTVLLNLKHCSILYLIFSSVFAGMAVISNYLLMVSWFPACIVIWERSSNSTCDFMKSCLMVCLHRLCCSRYFQLPCALSPSWLKCKCTCLSKLWNMREQILLDSILNFRFLWLILLSALAIASAVIVLYYPRLQLPSSPEFQLFDSSHPFEQYDLTYKHQFWFKRSQRVSRNFLFYRFMLVKAFFDLVS